MRTIHRSLVLVLLTVASPTFAFDFYLAMQKCSSTVGALTLGAEGDKTLATVDGTVPFDACSRSSRKVKCRIAFDDNSAPHEVTYDVLLDTPPTLVFGDPAGSDWFMVDTQQHAAVSISRIVGDRYAGSKVCHGGFMTEDEYNLYKKRD